MENSYFVLTEDFVFVILKFPRFHADETASYLFNRKKRTECSMKTLDWANAYLKEGGSRTYISYNDA